MTPEERFKNVRKAQEDFSTKISDLCRQIGFGLAAIAFTFISTENQFYLSLTEIEKSFVLKSAIAGCLVIAIEFLQYFFGWIASSLAARNHKNEYKQSIISKFFPSCFIVASI